MKKELLWIAVGLGAYYVWRQLTLVGPSTAVAVAASQPDSSVNMSPGTAMLPAGSVTNATLPVLSSSDLLSLLNSLSGSYVTSNSFVPLVAGQAGYLPSLCSGVMSNGTGSVYVSSPVVCASIKAIDPALISASALIDPGHPLTSGFTVAPAVLDPNLLSTTATTNLPYAVPLLQNFVAINGLITASAGTMYVADQTHAHIAQAAQFFVIMTGYLNTYPTPNNVMAQAVLAALGAAAGGIAQQAVLTNQFSSLYNLPQPVVALG